MITVFFTKKNSHYLSLGVVCYDIDRNATTFAGPGVVITHPPCRLWAGMRHFSTAPAVEKELGTFALNMVRKNGGVLEHPKKSLLFKDETFVHVGSLDLYGGFLLQVDMNWFGFPAQKPTMLYIVGCLPKDLPPYPLSLDAITHVIHYSGGSNPRKKELPKSMRDTTPLLMCNWLIDVATLIETNKNSQLKKNNKEQKS